MAVSAVRVRAYPVVRYQDQLAHSWLWTHGPCSWRRRVQPLFRQLPYRRLQPAGSLIDPDRVQWWLRQMRCGRHIPPLLACATGQGTFYLHDGNHRYLAMRNFFAPRPEAAPVRVGLLLPRPGYQFQYRWFGHYGTWLLLPAPPPHECRFGVLAAGYSSDCPARSMQ